MLEQQVEVDRLDVLVDIGVLHALQRALHQQFQLVQVAPELLLQALVLEEFYPQAQAGDRRAQVVGDGAEQLPALVQVAVDALMHGVEGARHLHQFAGAALLQRCRRTAQGQVAAARARRLSGRLCQCISKPVKSSSNRLVKTIEHLLRLQSLGFQADVRRRHQAGDVQPLAFADADLGHQHRRVHRLQGQRVVRPGTRQLVELQRAVEQAQLVGTDEFDLQLDLLAQALVQHVLDDLQHRLLVRRVRQGTHLQRPVVQRDEEARTAHAAQLVEHQRTVAERQGTEVADAGRPSSRPGCASW